MQALQSPTHRARELQHSALRLPMRGCALIRDHSVLPRAWCGKSSASLIHDIRYSVQIWSAGVTISGRSKVATVTSISSESGSLMKVSALPHVPQNERRRPAHAISRGLPVVNRKLLRRNEAQVANAAPVLLRQSSQ